MPCSIFFSLMLFINPVSDFLMAASSGLALVWAKVTHDRRTNRRINALVFILIISYYGIRRRNGQIVTPIFYGRESIMDLINQKSYPFGQLSVLYSDSIILLLPAQHRKQAMRSAGLRLLLLFLRSPLPAESVR